ncbi:hypothetical protein DQE80_17450, partial [Enterococcus sp. HPCN18]
WRSTAAAMPIRYDSCARCRCGTEPFCRAEPTLGCSAVGPKGSRAWLDSTKAAGQNGPSPPDGRHDAVRVVAGFLPAAD